MVPKGVWHPPQCRTILTIAVGVMEAVQPHIPCVTQEGVGPLCGATVRVLLEMEGSDV